MHSYSLFDYTTPTTATSHFTISQTHTLLRKGTACLLVADEKQFGEQLLRLVRREGNFNIDGFSVVTDRFERLWSVVSKRKGVQLQPGNVVKLGQEFLRVKEVGMTGAEAHQWSPDYVPVDTAELGPDVKCRICLSEEWTEENPLISPCHCTGSVQHIHLKCLQEWLNTCLSVSSAANLTTYHWKPLHCELCKTEFPAAISVGGKTQPLIDIYKLGQPFIVLESFGRRQASDMHVLSLRQEDSFTLGRSPFCAVTLSDMSVSRQHARITLTDSGFWIRDLGSKFGTLLEIPETSIRLEPGEEISLQCGRTVVRLKAYRPAKWLYICCRCCYPTERVMPEPPLHSASSVFHTTFNQVSEDLAEQSVPHGDEERTRLVIT